MRHRWLWASDKCALEAGIAVERDWAEDCEGRMKAERSVQDRGGIGVGLIGVSILWAPDFGSWPSQHFSTPFLGSTSSSRALDSGTLAPDLAPRGGLLPYAS